MHGRFLLRPSRELVDLFNGILIRAAERYPVEVCAFVALSNHSHLLLIPEDGEALSAFMTSIESDVKRAVLLLARGA
jgi:REP element-mobilizing transposase RayT